MISERVPRGSGFAGRDQEQGRCFHFKQIPQRQPGNGSSLHCPWAQAFAPLWTPHNSHSFFSLSASSPSPGLTTQPFLAWKAQPSLLLKFFPPQHQNYSTGRCLAFVSLHINMEKEGKG